MQEVLGAEWECTTSHSAQLSYVSMTSPHWLNIYIHQASGPQPSCSLESPDQLLKTACVLASPLKTDSTSNVGAQAMEILLAPQAILTCSQV